MQQFSWKILFVVASLAVRHIEGAISETASADDCTSEDETCMLQMQLAKRSAGADVSQVTEPKSKMPQVTRFKLGHDFKFNDHVQWSDASAPDRAHRHAHASSTCNSSARVWISQMGVDTTIHSIVPALLEVAERINIPPISGEDFSFVWSLSNFKISDVKFEVMPAVELIAGVGLHINFTGVSVTVSVDYSFGSSSFWNPLSSSGTIRVKTLNSTDLTGLLQLGADAMGKPVVSLEVEEFALELDELEIQGDWLSGMIEFAANLMRHALLEFVGPMLPGIIGEFANVEINNAIAAYDFRIPFNMDGDVPEPFDKFAADVGICAVSIEENYVSADVRAIIMNLEEELVYERPLPPLPVQPMANYETRSVAVELTPYGLNAGLWMMQHLGHLNFWMDPLPMSALQKTLAIVRRAHPHMRLSGDTSNVKLNLVSKTTPVLHFSVDGVSLEGDVWVGIYLDAGAVGDIEVMALRVPFNLTADVSVIAGDPQHLAVSLEHFSAHRADVIVKNNTVNMDGLIHMVNDLADGSLLPMVNDLLQDRTFALGPFNGVSFENTTIETGDKWLGGMTNLHINATELFEATDLLRKRRLVRNRSW